MITLTSHEDATGATFSEVLVALALTSVGVMGAMGAFQASDRGVNQGALATRALAEAESKIEMKRAVPWDQLLFDDLNHDGTPDIVMRDDGTGGDRTAGDGIYSAMLQQEGMTVIWTVAPRHGVDLGRSGGVVIEARAVYQTSFGEREVRLATLRANPSFAGSR
jgi:hypothetical protein